MICDNCEWNDCDSCPMDVDDNPLNSEIDILGIGDR